MDRKRQGWYYVVGGRLRYHDKYGWTEHYLEFDKNHQGEWPPPAPMSMLDQVLARQAADETLASHSKALWWRRKRRNR